MKQFFLQIINDTSKNMEIKSSHNLYSNSWFWISALEFGLIIFLIAKRKNKKNSLKSDFEEILDHSKSNDINMDDLMNNINKSRELYKQLSSKCHPDRFSEIESKKLAENIFQQLTAYKRDYNKLLEIKEIAQAQLNINF